MKVEIIIDVVSEDGEVIPLVGNGKKLIIRNVWNRKEQVELRFGNKAIVVDGNDLMSAISKAQHNRD